MKSLILITTLIWNFLAFGQSEEVVRLSGQFVIKKNIANQNSDLFFKIKDSDGKSYAYPVRVKNKKLNKSIRSNLNKTYTIEGIAKQRSIKVNETNRFVHFLDISSASIFDLKSLGIADSQHIDRDPDIPYYNREDPSKSKGGYRVSDKVANSVIFAAGAALLGTLIAK